MFDELEKALRRARISTLYNGIMGSVSLAFFHSCFMTCFFMTLFIIGIIAETKALYEWDEE